MKKNLVYLSLIFSLIVLIGILESVQVLADPSPVNVSNITELQSIAQNFDLTQTNNALIIKHFGNERINLYLENEEEKQIYLITKEGKVVDINYGKLPDATLNVYTDIETINQIEQGQLTFIDAVKQGKIRWKGVGFFNGLKIGIIKIFLRIFWK